MPASQDSHHHADFLRQKLEEIMRRAREDVAKVDDPKAQALFETTAEVLGGLCTALRHFEDGSEPAWR